MKTKIKLVFLVAMSVTFLQCSESEKINDSEIVEIIQETPIVKELETIVKNKENSKKISTSRVEIIEITEEVIEENKELTRIEALEAIKEISKN